MSDKSQLGFKPFCITCELFETCGDVPLVEDPDELDAFDEAMDSLGLDSEKVEEFFNSSTTANTSKLDNILLKNPEMKMVVEVFKLQHSPAIWEAMNRIPEPKQMAHHHLGVTDLESIVGHTVFMELLLSRKFNNESSKDLLDMLGPEVLIGVLSDKLIKIYATHPEVLIEDLKEFADPFNVLLGGKKK